MSLTVKVTRPSDPEGQVYHFSSSPIRIGRSPLNNLVIDDPWVSQHHGLVHFAGGQAHYSDLGSKNGTVVITNESTFTATPSQQVLILAPSSSEARLMIGIVGLTFTRTTDESEATVNSELAERNRHLATRLTNVAMRSVGNLPGRLPTPQNPVAVTPSAPIRRPTPLPAAPPRRPSAEVPATPPGGVDPFSGDGYSPGRTYFVDGPKRSPSSGAFPSVSPPSASAMPVAPAPLTPSSAEPSSGQYVAGHTQMVGLDEGKAMIASLNHRMEEAAARQPIPPRQPAVEVSPVVQRIRSIWSQRSTEPAPALDPSSLAFVERLAAIAEACAQGIFELKRGLRDFGNGIGVRTMGSRSPLHIAGSAEDLLTYLLDPKAAPGERLEQLVDLIADVMVHEFALLNGVKAGVRELVDHLDPNKGFAASDAAKGKGFALFDRSLKRYSEHFGAATEDQGLGIVLGQGFAKAYAETVGDSANSAPPTDPGISGLKRR